MSLFFCAVGLLFFFSLVYTKIMMNDFLIEDHDRRMQNKQCYAAVPSKAGGDVAG